MFDAKTNVTCEQGFNAFGAHEHLLTCSLTSIIFAIRLRSAAFSRKRIFFSDPCRCSMWTLHWILCEPIWKPCYFCEPLQCTGISQLEPRAAPCVCAIPPRLSSLYHKPYTLLQRQLIMHRNRIWEIEYKKFLMAVKLVKALEYNLFQKNLFSPAPAKDVQKYNITRMHSSRMRTARSSSRRGGGLYLIPLNFPLGCGPGPDPLNFPLGCGPGSDPPQFSPWVWAWTWSPSISPLGVGLNLITLNFPLGCEPGAPPPQDQTPLPGSRHPPRDQTPSRAGTPREQNDKQVQKYYLAPNFVCGR